MRGRNFHTYPIERVLADIADARAHGARAIFLVDDNITLDVARFEALCQAIIDAGFNDIDYIVQAMTSPIAAARRDAGAADAAGRLPLRVPRHRERPRRRSRRSCKARRQERAPRATAGRSATPPSTAIEHLHRHGMFVVGGLIVGNPDDTRESIEANLAFARRYVDWPYIQHPTPYPRHADDAGFRERGLIVDEDVEDYDGTTAVVRSEHVAAEEIEFLRWRAERWMKVRHMPAPSSGTVPGSCCRTGVQMLAHTFRGGELLESPAGPRGRAPHLRALPRHSSGRASVRLRGWRAGAAGSGAPDDQRLVF